MRRLRERAVWQTRHADLAERLAGRDGLKGGKLKIVSIDVEEAHKFLDRLDANPTEAVLTHAERAEHAEGHLDIIPEQACSWAFGNAIRTSALQEIVRMVMVLEEKGVEVNVAALGRLTGVSRQTLHARLSEAREVWFAPHQ
jgi:hypothetical protein